MIISLNLSEKLECNSIAVILAVHKSANELAIPFFLIGATARDIILQHEFNIDPIRSTVDVDFAVQVENWGKFNQLKQNHH